VIARYLIVGLFFLMKLFSWPLFGVVADGLLDTVAVQVHVAADGEMEIVSDKHLLSDDYDGTSGDGYQMGLPPRRISWGEKQKLYPSGSEGCRAAESDCRVAYTVRWDFLELQSTAVPSSTDNTPSMGQEYNEENQEHQLALDAALEYCESLCTEHEKCDSFYLLKDAETNEEFCNLYAEDTCDDCVSPNAVLDERGQWSAESWAVQMHDEGEQSKYNLCIWQPESQFVGNGKPLCHYKVSRTPAEEEAEVQAFKNKHALKAGEEKAEFNKILENLGAAAKVAAEKECQRPRWTGHDFQIMCAKQQAAEGVRVAAAAAELLTFEGEVGVGESIQIKNVMQGKCLSASGGRGANLTFSECSDSSTQLRWMKRPDGSFESAAYPGLCPRQGDGAGCRREFVELGECPGFILHSGGNGLLLKMEQDGGACLGTWIQSTYRDDPNYPKGIYDGMGISPHYKDHVMTTAHACTKGGGQGEKWEMLPSAADSGGSGGDAPAYETSGKIKYETSLAGCPDEARLKNNPEQGTKTSEVLAFRCCNSDNDAKVPMNNNCNTGTYSEAIDMCEEEEGLALCTTDQINTKNQCGSGCGYDFSRVWTRTLFSE